MENVRQLRRRLFIGFILIAILNLCIVSVSIYIYARGTLIEKGDQHLSSVRSLASKKLVFFLEKLKYQAIEATTGRHDVILTPALAMSLVSITQYGPKGVELIHGEAPYPVTEVIGLKSEVFLALPGARFGLKIPINGNEVLWVFNFEGISDLLKEREGLGATGEIYLVGSDYKIKSASRFMKEVPKNELVNASTLEGFKNHKGNEIVKDYRDIKVLSAYSLFEFDELKYVLLAEMDFDEIIMPLTNAMYDLFFGYSALILLSLGLAFSTARNIFKKINRMTHQIRDLHYERAAQVIKAQEDERERIAYNLHDSAGQYLTALKWAMSKLTLECEGYVKTRLGELATLCDDVIQEVRLISHDIMPSMLKDFGCFLAIKDYLDKQSKLLAIKIDYHYPVQFEGMKFIEGFDVNIYRMVQEFIQNSIKHSQAKTVKLFFEKEDNKLLMTYEDDGIGMKNGALPRSLMYRAQLFGGRMDRLKRTEGLAFRISFDVEDISNEQNQNLSIG